MRLSVVLLIAVALASPSSAQDAGLAFTLADALERARAASASRRAATLRLTAAEEAMPAAGRLQNPLSELRWENFASGTPGGFPLDVFATLTQPVEMGGERAARRGAARAAAESARAALSGVVAEADLHVAQRYLEAVRARDGAATLRAQSESLAALLRILQRRVEEGVAAEADLRRLEVERARVDLERLRRDVAAARALHALTGLLGPGVAVALAALQSPVVPPLPVADDAALSAAIERRPDVASARARLAVAREALRFEEARRVPDLNVTGGWKRTSGLDTGVFAVTVPVPLFDRNAVGITLARGQYQGAEQDLAHVRTVATADIRATAAAARQLTDEAGRLRASLAPPAAVARAAARAAFESGAGDLLRVVDAERTYTETELVLHDLAAEAVLAAIEARLASADSPLP